MTHVPIPGMCLEVDASITVSEVALGLTLYLDEPLSWAEQAAGAALNAFLQRAPAHRLTWYATSLQTDWQRVGEKGLPKLAANLSNAQLLRPRHLFSFEVVDDTDVPTTGFLYREFDPARVGTRASILELTLPQDTDPQVLLQLAMEVGRLAPWWCGIGGYVARWNPMTRNTSFTEIHRWAQRYLGLDVQDAEPMSWKAVAALPGSNWLTMIGKPMAGARAIDLEALASRRWKHPVEVTPVDGRGAIVRAGPQPTAGDRNRITEYPKVYAEVACALAPYFVDEPPSLDGEFWRQEDTRAWLRRFLEPEAWR